MMTTRASFASATDIPDLPWIDPSDRDRVAEITRRIYPAVRAGTTELPAGLRDRAPNVCLLWASACPDAPLPTLVTLCRWAIAVGGFDDRVDDLASACSTDLGALCEAYAGAAEEPPARCLPEGACASWQLLLDVVVACCRELRALPHADRGYPAFARHQAAMFRGMATELGWREALVARGELPSYEEYARTGALTIGAPACLAALLCASPAPAPEAALFEAIALACGACIRLSNDLRSGAREMLEERKPNSISILMHRHGLTEDAARARVGAALERHGRELAGLVAQLPEELRIWGAWALRLERVTRALYRVQDYRDVAQALHRWLGSIESPALV